VRGTVIVRVIVNETTVEIGEAGEGLNIFDLLRLRPIPNHLDFLFGHRKSIGREHIAEELHRISVPFTVIGFGIDRDCVAEDIVKLHTDVFPVLRRVIGINQDVVEVDNDANIEHNAENVIHEMLKNRRTVGKTERHDLPLK
jgi:hypothetical protein